MKKNKHNYKNGMARIYKDKQKKTDFNAQINPTSLSDLEFIVKLAFDEMSKRQQDREMAISQGSELSLKIVTPLKKGINTKYKVVINKMLYDIISIDEDKENSELYFYMQEVREIAE